MQTHPLSLDEMLVEVLEQEIGPIPSLLAAIH